LDLKTLSSESVGDIISDRFSSATTLPLINRTSSSEKLFISIEES